MQSDKPAELHLAGNTSMKGHYGVVSLYADNKLQYMYLGHGQAIAWNGFRIESPGSNTASFVEFRDDSLLVSSNGEITMRFPYRIAEVKDNEGHSMNIITDADENRSMVTFPAGMERKYYISMPPGKRPKAGQSTLHRI